MGLPGGLQPEFQESHFLGDTHFTDVIRFRRRILSGLFQLFAREVVPGLDYRRAQILEKIRQEFPGIITTSSIRSLP